MDHLSVRIPNILLDVLKQKQRNISTDLILCIAQDNLSHEDFMILRKELDENYEWDNPDIWVRKAITPKKEWGVDLEVSTVTSIRIPLLYIDMAKEKAQQEKITVGAYIKYLLIKYLLDDAYYIWYRCQKDIEFKNRFWIENFGHLPEED